MDKSDPGYSPLNVKLINLEKFLDDFYMWYGSLSAIPLDQKGDPKQLNTVQKKPSPTAISKDKSTEDTIANFKKHPVVINVIETAQDADRQSV